MTRDELLAKIDTLEARYTDYSSYLALRAVVELHEVGVNGTYCMHCISEGWLYPCPTISAIEKALI